MNVIDGPSKTAELFEEVEPKVIEEEGSINLSNTVAVVSATPGATKSEILYHLH